MTDFKDLSVDPKIDEQKMQMSFSLEKPADVASRYASSSSVPEAATYDDEEFKKQHQSHGEASGTSWKLIAHGNRSSKYVGQQQEVTQYQTCNKVATLQGGKNDADYTWSNSSRYGMHEDLLFYIMLWLPVASLLRIRSVCRLWCSLIDSSTFITQHYNHNSNKSCLLAHHMVSSYESCYNSKFCLLSGNNYEVYSTLKYEQPWYSTNEITILNSCNGLVCLLNKSSQNVALWNPATKQLRPLPESLISRQYLSLHDGMSVKFGIGFDAKKNDYKVVKIFYHGQNKHNSIVEVYNLRTDSWRTIHKDNVLPSHHIECDVATCKKGTCFWIGHTHQDENSPILISFNLYNEIFGTMPLPGECDPAYCSYAYNSLDLINGKLCYIQSVNLDPCNINHIYFEIWMLDENGAKESWKRICKFGGSFEMGPSHVLRFSKNEDFLLLGFWYKYGELCLSSCDAQEEEHLELQNSNPLLLKFVCSNKLLNPNPVLSKFVWYNESLVSLKREDDGAYKRGFIKSDMEKIIE